MTQRAIVLVCAAGIASACANASPEALSASDEGREPDSGSKVGACVSTADCPVGLLCQSGVCVTPEGLPPETDLSRTYLRPEAAGRFLFVLSPENDSVTLVETATLAVRTVLVPAEPVALAPLPGLSAVLVLSRSGKALSIIDASGAGEHLTTQSVPRRFEAVSLSPDGRRAVLWTPDGTIPDEGSEGIVGIADVRALQTGAPVAVVERAAGRRHTDVLFRSVAGEAVEAVIVGKQELRVVDVRSPAEQAVPERIVLPAEWAEVATREAVAPPGGDHVLLRNVSVPSLLVLRTAARALVTVDLPAPASDLAMSSDGSLAVAVLRAASKTAWFPLPGGLDDPSLVRVAEVSLPGRNCTGAGTCTAAPGQAALAPDASFAALFTNAQASSAFALLDLAAGTVKPFDRLRKLVRALGVSPDGHSAVVLHAAEPGSTLADLYERHVAQSEGYSAVDLASGDTQLKLTDEVTPMEFVFAPGAREAGVTLRRDVTRDWRVDAVDLATLVTAQMPMASPPLYAGALPVSSGAGRIWITQQHPAGRISFVDLAGRSVRTVTGFDLNSEIE